MSKYAYQIAYYLLQDEAMARRAAECTLTELYRQDSFFGLTGHGQGASVKAASMRHALKEKARAL